MIIRIFSFENELEVSDDSVAVIYIENKILFSKLVSNFFNISSGFDVDDRIAIIIDEKNIELSKELYFCMDFFNFDYNQKKILSALYKEIENELYIEEEKMGKIFKLYNEIVCDCEDIVSEFPFFIKYKDSITICDFLKMIDLKIENFCENSFLERVLKIIEIISFSKIYRIIVFVNLKTFLNEEELVELYKYSIYNNIKLIVLEQNEFSKKLEYEKILYIDEDYYERIV